MGGVVAQGLPAALRRQGPRREAEKASPPATWMVHPPRAAVYEPALPPPGAYARPPPKLKPRAKTWDGVRDGGPGAQEATVARIRLGDLDLSGCRPVSLYLWGSTYVRGA